MSARGKRPIAWPPVYWGSNQAISRHAYMFARYGWDIPRRVASFRRLQHEVHLREVVVSECGGKCSEDVEHLLRELVRGCEGILARCYDSEGCRPPEKSARLAEEDHGLAVE